jgi:hypothetical protein
VLVQKIRTWLLSSRRLFCNVCTSGGCQSIFDGLKLLISVPRKLRNHSQSPRLTGVDLRSQNEVAPIPLPAPIVHLVREAVRMTSILARGKYRAGAALKSVIAVGMGLAIAGLGGCGGDGTSTDSGKPSTPTVEAARESIKQQAKVKGKALPADTNLSARERRALKQQGEVPK